jgi:hypothetical protein
MMFPWGRFNSKDFENGYSRNLLWRLWHAAKLFKLKHLFELCSQVSRRLVSVVLWCKEESLFVLHVEIKFIAVLLFGDNLIFDVRLGLPLLGGLILTSARRFILSLFRGTFDLCLEVNLSSVERSV